jgi:hypothetical protein
VSRFGRIAGISQPECCGQCARMGG